MSKVWVELDKATDLPIRIFRTDKDARASEGVVREMDRGDAIGKIRQQVVKRATKKYLINCEFCGRVITESSGHMHEVLPRGSGGEYSLENSRFICAECHIGPDGEHGARRFQSARTNLDK